MKFARHDFVFDGLGLGRDQQLQGNLTKPKVGVGVLLVVFSIPTLSPLTGPLPSHPHPVTLRGQLSLSGGLLSVFYVEVLVLVDKTSLRGLRVYERHLLLIVMRPITMLSCFPRDESATLSRVILFWTDHPVFPSRSDMEAIRVEEMHAVYCNLCRAWRYQHGEKSNENYRHTVSTSGPSPRVNVER